MRRFILSIATAAIISTGLVASVPASAYEGYRPYATAYYVHDGWRERAWRWHLWREHQAWRHHRWEAWHWRHDY